MYRSRRTLSGIAAAIVALVPLVASAQTPSVETADEVRAEFLNAGFLVDSPSTWWTDGSTSFVAYRDARSSPADDRLLMVVVYPDVQTAEVARQRQAAAEPSEASLLPGYGPGVWQDNVVIAQSTLSVLNRRLQAQLDADAGISTQPYVAQAPRVDAEILTVLRHGLPVVDL